MGRMLFVAFLAAPLSCWAHMTGSPHSIASGLLHPLTGIDHLFALLAVGWMAHTQQRLAGRLALAALFLTSMLAGAGLGIAGFSSPIVEYAICISLIVTGAIVVLPIQREYAGILVVVAGLCHGMAHGSECPASANSAIFLAGMVASSALLLATGILAHHGIKHSRAEFAVRLAISTCLVVAGTCLLGQM